MTLDDKSIEFNIISCDKNNVLKGYLLLVGFHLAAASCTK